MYNKEKNMGLKINLHITQKCNYHCRYCFAHFENERDLAVGDWKRIIDNIYASGDVDSINFSGGEPVLYSGFPELLAYARNKGFRLSVISNGSLMLNQVLMPPKAFSMLDTLGISVDSLNEDTLVRLGACTRSHEVLSSEKLSRLVLAAKKNNPSIKIKLNSVVTNLNYAEELSSLSREISVDRWKILRMKAFRNGSFSNEDLAVSDESFMCFVDHHRGISKDVVVENSLARSYIMVDNRGQLLDNIDENYHVMGNLLNEKFSDVFSRYLFDRETYDSRYSENRLSAIAG